LEKTSRKYIDESAGVLLKIELLRRLSKFEEAGFLIDESMSKIKSDKNAMQIIVFQKGLILKRDTSAHRIDEGLID